jgi:hypothetical protein
MLMFIFTDCAYTGPYHLLGRSYCIVTGDFCELVPRCGALYLTCMGQGISQSLIVARLGMSRFLRSPSATTLFNTSTMRDETLPASNPTGTSKAKGRDA